MSARGPRCNGASNLRKRRHLDRFQSRAVQCALSTSATIGPDRRSQEYPSICRISRSTQLCRWRCRPTGGYAVNLIRYQLSHLPQRLREEHPAGFAVLHAESRRLQAGTTSSACWIAAEPVPTIKQFRLSETGDASGPVHMELISVWT